MGIQTERGQDDLPSWLLDAAANLANRLDASQHAELYRLVSNASWGMEGYPSEWQPFDGLLMSLGIDRSDLNHVTALLLTLGLRRSKQEKTERTAAVDAAREHHARAGVQAQWGTTGSFAAPKK